MSLEDLGNIGEFIAAVGVIVSLSDVRNPANRSYPPMKMPM